MLSRFQNFSTPPPQLERMVDFAGQTARAVFVADGHVAVESALPE